MSDHDHDHLHPEDRKTEYDVECERREMRRVLWPKGVRPDESVRITRRMFLHRSLLTGVAAGAAGAAVTGWFPIINSITYAHAATDAPFSFAWISDTHLYPETLNTLFVDKVKRAVKEVQAMNPPPDFLIFGGDSAQLGRAEELELGNQILKEIKLKKHFIPGEHDWYFDMGKKWTQLYGPPNWTFDHKGVRFIGLDTISRAPDYWSATKMTPEMRMDHMSVLDGTVAGAWAGVGDDQIAWMQNVLSDWKKDAPVVIISHNPLYECYPPWNFWVRDWRKVHEVLKPYTKVTNFHGHVHQVLYNEIGSLRSIGMLATAWNWPYPPKGVPALTRMMMRVDPSDPYDGTGWGIVSQRSSSFEPQYVMWGRAEIFSNNPADVSSYHPEILHPRIADNGWFWSN